MARYLDLRQLAEHIGVEYSTAQNYHRLAEARRKADKVRPGDLPEPDLRVAGHPAWMLSTVLAWQRRRPGRGKGGGRPRKPVDPMALALAKVAKGINKSLNRSE